MGFVLVFLVCHFPRIFLNMHEMYTLSWSMECLKHTSNGFTMWSLVLVSVSHFLLVVNCSSNILVYCFMSSKFRQECRKIFTSYKGFLSKCNKSARQSCRLKGSCRPHLPSPGSTTRSSKTSLFATTVTTNGGPTSQLTAAADVTNVLAHNHHPTLTVSRSSKV